MNAFLHKKQAQRKVSSWGSCAAMLSSILEVCEGQNAGRQVVAGNVRRKKQQRGANTTQKKEEEMGENIGED